MMDEKLAQGIARYKHRMCLDIEDLDSRLMEFCKNHNKIWNRGKISKAAWLGIERELEKCIQGAWILEKIIECEPKSMTKVADYFFCTTMLCKSKKVVDINNHDYGDWIVVRVLYETNQRNSELSWWVDLLVSKHAYFRYLTRKDQESPDNFEEELMSAIDLHTEIECLKMPLTIAEEGVFVSVTVRDGFQGIGNSHKMEYFGRQSTREMFRYNIDAQCTSFRTWIPKLKIDGDWKEEVLTFQEKLKKDIASGVSDDKPKWKGKKAKETFRKLRPNTIVQPNQ